MSKPVSVEDFISVLKDTQLNQARAERADLEQNEGELNKELNDDLHSKVLRIISKLEQRKDVLEAYYEAVIIGKVMLLKLRKVISEDGIDLLRVKQVLKVPLDKFVRSVEGRVASLEHGVIEFANFDRARVTLGLKSSAGDARAREAVMGLEETFKAFRKSVHDGQEKAESK